METAGNYSVIHIYFARDAVVRETGVKHGNMSLVILFSAVAVLILLIGCVNFINLVTARSSSRAKEISVRKAAGAVRKNLIVQFLGETSLTVLVSLALALVLVAALLPSFARLTGEPLDENWLQGFAYRTRLGAGPFLLASVSALAVALLTTSFQAVKVWPPPIRPRRSGTNRTPHSAAFVVPELCPKMSGTSKPI
jgi:ABC-type antimicrobial peptide transport system permease subunit